MRWLLAALLAAGALAGCLDGEGAPKVQAAPTVPLPLAEGGVFAFAHADGPLQFQMTGNGSADLVLFDGHDRRVGRILVGDQPEAVSTLLLEHVAGPEPVLQVQALNGSLQVVSGDKPVDAFHPLLTTLQRVTLANRAPDAALGLPGNPLASTFDVPLQRAPLSISVLASGGYADLDVHVSSRIGPTFLLTGGAGGEPLPAVVGPSLADVKGTAYAQNFDDGQWTGRIDASDFDGALVLEAVLYSRAPLAGPAQPVLREDEVRFWFGRLPAEPVEFEVRAGSSWIYLENRPDDGDPSQAATGPSPAWIAIFDPEDLRLATVLVPANATVAVPVSQAGKHVAVLLAGQASLGSDRTPADISLHPLETQAAEGPQAAAGSRGQYGQRQGELAAQGVPYRVATVLLNDGVVSGAPFLGCSGGERVRLSQGGEGLFVASLDTFAQAEAGDALGAALRLGGGTFQLDWDGFGPSGCPRPGVAVFGYVRSSNQAMD